MRRRFDKTSDRIANNDQDVHSTAAARNQSPGIVQIRNTPTVEDTEERGAIDEALDPGRGGFASAAPAGKTPQTRRCILCSITGFIYLNSTAAKDY
jgi:hypothetical protein